MSRPLAAILTDLGLTTHRSDVLWAWCAHRSELRKRERRRLDYAKGIVMHRRNRRLRAGQFAEIRAMDRAHRARMAEIDRLYAMVRAVRLEFSL